MHSYLAMGGVYVVVKQTRPPWEKSAYGPAPEEICIQACKSQLVPMIPSSKWINNKNFVTSAHTSMKDWGTSSMKLREHFPWKWNISHDDFHQECIFSQHNYVLLLHSEIWPTIPGRILSRGLHVHVQLISLLKYEQRGKTRASVERARSFWYNKCSHANPRKF